MDSISVWNVINSIFGVVEIIAGVLLWMIFLYYISISAFAWVKRKEASSKDYPPVHRFALLVAAHNEEKVISNIIHSLKLLKYPKEMYDVIVIADNCNDNTAAIARECGAMVFERTDLEKRGKGFSLEWMFKKLFEMDKHYDAISVFDADNIVSSNFLLEMNKHLCMGHKVIQGYIDSKNPTDSWISGNNSIAFWISNRLIQLPRYYLGLSCILGGTGFVIATDVLKRIGWGATCLTEDLEFTLKLILQKMKVYWSHDAIVYDEKPLRIAQSWKQRKRWMQGHFDCAGRFLKKLIVTAVKERDLVAFDSVLYMVQPVIVVVNGIGLVAGLLNIALSIFHAGGVIEVNTLLFAMTMVVLVYMSVLFVILEGKISLKVVKYFLLLPVYNLTWVPIIIQGFMNRRKKEWVHTLHTKAVDITEIESLEKVG